MDYSRVMQPLHILLEAALQQVGRTKRLAAGFTLSWNDDDKAAFTTARNLLATTQLLHFPDDSASLCVFSDASERGWGLLVSQVREWNDALPVVEQQHELLLCKSGVFSDTEQRWSIIEKEAFPIIFAARNLGYLLVRRGGFRLYCDHKNLVFVFAPDKEVKRHVRGKLQRWALSLTGLAFQVEHIDGTDNLWADLLSRWGLPVEEAGVSMQCKFITRSRARELAEAADAEESDSVVEPEVRVDQDHTHRVDQVHRGHEVPEHSEVLVDPNHTEPVDQVLRLHMISDDFEFPSLGSIRAAQEEHASSAPLEVGRDDSGLVLVNDRLWVPAAATELLQRIFVISHCGLQGHRGLEPMVSTIESVFSISGLSALCRRFLSRCLLCKHVKGGNIITRPWGPTYDATEPNELLHWDFLFMGESAGASKYVLVLKDGLSHNCELIACDSASSIVAATALVDWWKRFGAPSVLISDQGSHFKNAVVQQVCKKLQLRQELVVAYSPWINGTVERVNRDILQVMRVLLMELKLDTHEWVYLLPLVQGNLNHTPVASLGNRSPVETFTGLRRPSPFEPVIIEMNGKPVVLTEDIALPGDRMERLRSDLMAMHREVVDLREKRRLQNMQLSKGSPCNFAVGDFVLWSILDQRLTVDKLLARWVGPFEVVETRPHSFVIRHLVTDQTFDVHCSRLKFYSNSALNVDEEMLAHIGNQGMLLGVEAIKHHRNEHGDWQLFVSWVGLQDEEDSWESLRSMNAQVPATVAQYILAAEDPALSAAYKAIAQH
ncbi:hypothetical protein PF007_g29768 [Phytophthora fragariae]|uniref:Integrase catalytic domain-containing protein n=2 Tax=Phytophthora fragariae TaxID=53985 RepID=A0A6A3PX71_9STRA|nr:hypothetical protein PF007_g29768 [Phytophthora fragariae]